MGRLVAGFVISLAVLAAFPVVLYGLPVAAALGPLAGSAILLFGELLELGLAFLALFTIRLRARARIAIAGGVL